MSTVAAALSQLGALDDLAARDSAVHRLDPRAKVLTTFAFVIAVVSFDRYQVSAMLGFALYPVVLAAVGGIPLGYIARKLALVSPFILMVAVFNPLLDRAPMIALGPLTLSAGWISFLSILLRAVLALSSVMLLLATTGLNGVAAALHRLGVPRAFVVQLLFLYRYIFVLVEEANRLEQARAMRSFGRRGAGLRPVLSLLGHLLLRTLGRAERIHQAMLARGFQGRVHLNRRLDFGITEALFTLSWVMVFIFMRKVNVALLLGDVVTSFPGLS